MCILPKKIMVQMDPKEMLRAAKNCDSSYDGHFFVAVKSTGVFCLPSCRAKFPLVKNIEFYSSKEEALEAGYRGCKRCHSSRYPHTQPQWLDDLVEFIKKNSHQKLLESDFENKTGKHISTIRRYFKEHYQTTPSDYHRILQLQHAKRKVERGEDYRNVAFSCGYESISGFREAFYNHFGYNPGEINT